MNINMELTIERLRRIYQHESNPKTKKASKLALSSQTITQSEPSAASIEKDEYDDAYLSEEDNEVPVQVEPVVVQAVGTKDLAATNSLVDAYTVCVGNHRILTLDCSFNTMASRWVREILRSFSKKKKNNTQSIVVGVCVDRSWLRFERTGLKDYTYDIITLCVGSQCLIYYLPDRWCQVGPLPLTALFSDPRVIAAGVNMKAVAAKLFKDHGLRISNVMDLNETAEEVMVESFQLDLRRYNLDKLGKAVMGKEWSIERPEGKMELHGRYVYWPDRSMTETERVMYVTYDAYASLSIGAKLMDMKSGKKGGKANKKGSTINN